jgi:hypothetical protein
MLYRTLLAALAIAAPIAALAVSPAEIADQAAASVKRSPKWERIEVQRAEAGDYSLVIWYKAAPAGYDEVERDTKALASAVLKSLQAAGKRPADERITVFTRGRKAERGETGKHLVRVYGRTDYDYNNDRLRFERDK